MLIKTVEELKEYIPTDTGTNLNKINSFIRNAEHREIVKVLGSALYNELLAAYTLGFDEDTESSSSGELREEQLQALLPYVQKPLAYFAFMDAIPILDLVVTSTGFGVVQTNQIAPASNQRVQAFKKGVEKAAYDGIEALIEYLEENIAIFDTWQSSTAYSIQKDHLVVTAREFNKYVEIDNNRLIYLKLLPTMYNVEQFEIAASISKDLLEEIIEEAKDGDLTEANQVIYDLLKPAAANIAMGKGLPLIANAIYAEGVMKNYSIGESSPAGKEATDEIRKEFISTGHGYLSKARQYILDNVDDFPTYKASDLYVATDLTVGPAFENKTENQTFIFGGGIH
jgi:hypothetical protein